MTANINAILASEQACSRYGADMGRRSQREGQPERLHLQRVRFIDYCYDAGGAYWGGPANLWCAFSQLDTMNAEPIRVYCRADDRQSAKQAIREQLSGEGWTFFR
jgi:hypothetical protein